MLCGAVRVDGGLGRILTVTVNAETAVGEAERRELQASIEQSTIRRASLLSMAEKIRLGADLYDDGMRWMIQLIKAERPEWSEPMVDQELERRKAIKRRVEETGRFRLIEGDDEFGSVQL